MGFLELYRASQARTGRSHPRLLSAFTLIEVLVSISIVGILIALAIPAIARARASARATVCLSNLRGLGQTVEQYLSQFSQRYPFAVAGQPWSLSPLLDPGDGGLVITGNHFDFGFYWHTTVQDIAPWTNHFAAWVCPGSPRVKGRPWKFSDGRLGDGLASYSLTSGFFADPKLWSGSSPADGRLLRAVQASEVLFPSSKSMMFDAENAHRAPREDTDPLVQLFADGHASTHRLSRARPPVTNPFLGTARYLSDTPNGVAGTDY